MKYYITGANGFIGKNLCEYLEGEQVIPLSEGDKIHNAEPFIMVHLAAYGQHNFQKDTGLMIDTNVNELYRFVKAVKECNLIKFYNFSTSSVTLPVQTLYSATKLVGEKIIESLNDPRFVNIRPYSVYGPGEADHRFIPTVIRCLRSGEKMQLDPLAVHDWIFVEDLINAMFDGYTEIGTGVQYSNIEVVKMLEVISGEKLHYEEVKGLRAYDTKDWKAPKAVPHRDIYEGLKQTYEAA